MKCKNCGCDVGSSEDVMEEGMDAEEIRGMDEENTSTDSESDAFHKGDPAAGSKAARYEEVEHASEMDDGDSENMGPPSKKQRAIVAAMRKLGKFRNIVEE